MSTISGIGEKVVAAAASGGGRIARSGTGGSPLCGRVEFGSSEYIPMAAVRRVFEEFFETRDHRPIPNAKLVAEGDPTLLYINSGMAAIKRFFTGEEKPEHPNMFNAQGCIRTGDIDDVGDMHHLTYFRMLGSWSVDGYEKEEAISLARTLLMDVFKFPKERIFATVYAGDPEKGIPADEVSMNAWKKMGFDDSHIVPLGEDNFWGPAGDTGPCGPCTEVFFDMGDAFAPAYEKGKPETFDTKHRYVEIWNAGVFMQYDKKADGTLGSLPYMSIDTGSGLERMTMTLNQLSSVYETDAFVPVLDAIRDMAKGVELPESSNRLLADHLKAATYLLAENVRPGNKGKEYIPRKLIRRCVATLYASNLKEFDARPVFEVIISQGEEEFPYLREKQEMIVDVFTKEVQSFKKLLRGAIKKIDKNMPEEGSKFSGKVAFDLFTSTGVPVEVQQAYLRAKGIEIDIDTYHRLFEEHKLRSKK